MAGGGGDDIATQRAWVEVDLAALRANVVALTGLLSSTTELWAVVKANAYGHGAVPVAQTAIAAGAAGLCAATLPEGLEFRSAGLEAPILLLGALRTHEELTTAAQHDLEVTITAREQLPLCERVAAELQAPIPVHLKVDTGMSRLGVPPQEVVEIWQRLCDRPAFVPRSLYSHLATADDPGHPATEQQLQSFRAVVSQLEAMGLPLPPLHVANSAATLATADWHYQRVRVGLAMYGISPADAFSDRCQLQPVMNVKARIVHLKTVPAGTGVSYGHRFVAEKDTRLATVAIGYADGVPRCLSGQLQGFVGSYRLQQVGNVTMDQTLWVVPETARVRVGDVVSLFGPGWTSETWAERLGTIPYEILCGFSSRLPRRLLAGTVG